MKTLSDRASGGSAIFIRWPIRKILPLRSLDSNAIYPLIAVIARFFHPLCASSHLSASPAKP
jgi:hypothetical protein